MRFNRYLPWILSLITLRQTQQSLSTPFRARNFFGSVLIIFLISLSFLQLSNVFHGWIAQFDQAILIEVSVLSSIILIGFILLNFLFRKISTPQTLPATDSSEVISLNLPSVASKFVEGFKEGMH
ncbi:MAG: hypothetical protein QE271_12910 [Bacteriovoracaceae bacterium]|nr:hypothetical protein [Bacteriovoracaceae bacterium]